MELDNSAAMTPREPKSSHVTPPEAAHLIEGMTGVHHLSWSLPGYLAFPIGFTMLSASITAACGLIIVTSIWIGGPLVTAGRTARPELVRASKFPYGVQIFDAVLAFRIFVYVHIWVDNGEGTMSCGKIPWKVAVDLSFTKSVCVF